MPRAVILDLGGVLMYPRRGHWLIPRDIEEILASPLPQFDATAVAQAHAACAHWIDEGQIVTSLRRETELRYLYTRDMARQLRFPLTDAQARAIAESLARDSKRHALYDDVKEGVHRLAQRLTVGILSNAMPSISLTLMESGLMREATSVVISTTYGLQKPDERLYRQSLRDLNLPARECVFVDDLEKNLLAAERVGMRAVHMLRPFYGLETPAPFTVWQGPTVRNLAELDLWLRENEGIHE